MENNEKEMLKNNLLVLREKADSGFDGIIYLLKDHLKIKSSGINNIHPLNEVITEDGLTIEKLIDESNEMIEKDLDRVAEQKENIIWMIDYNLSLIDEKMTADGARATYIFQNVAEALITSVITSVMSKEALLETLCMLKLRDAKHQKPE